METPPAGYHVLNPETVLTYACSVPGHEKWLGPSATPSLLTAKEIGDGNLNLVFIVSRGDSHKVIIKQALPYVRCIGDSWPLPLKRAFFESEVLKEENETAPGLGNDFFIILKSILKSRKYKLNK
jgi:5-methylthioribose kinase